MLVTMNDKEIFRLGTIRDVCEQRIKHKDATQLLNLCMRQVQRLMTRYREPEAVGLVHQRRGNLSDFLTLQLYFHHNKRC